MTISDQIVQGNKRKKGMPFLWQMDAWRFDMIHLIVTSFFHLILTIQFDHGLSVFILYKLGM